MNKSCRKWNTSFETVWDTRVINTGDMTGGIYIGEKNVGDEISV